MYPSLKEKTIIITGAAQGIGLSLGQAFAKEGANVYLTDLQEDKAMTEAELLRSQGFNVNGLALDVASEENIIQTIDQIVSETGRLDIVINNAGMQYISPIDSFPTETFEQMVKIMQIAPFMMIKKVFPIMKKQKFGRIINMASINGLIGFAGKAAYNSAKHGVIGLSKVAALEGAEHGITVNALCPGYVDTPLVQNQLKDLAVARDVPLDKVMKDVIYPLVPQKRLIHPDEIADYALFLSSDQAKGVTGQAVVLDGGYTTQ